MFSTIYSQGYKCEICEKHFKRRDHFKQHKLNHLKEPAKLTKMTQIEPQTCSICGASVVHLYQHINQIHSTKPSKKYKCDHCDYRTHIKSVFERHIDTVHLKKMEYTCYICTKNFSLQLTLDLHLHSVHSEKTDLKEYKCEFCDYKTVRKVDIGRHKMTHLDLPASFHCDICGKFYKSARLVKQHKYRNHEIRDDRKCDLCNKHFTRPNRLKEHMSSVHLGITVDCDICGASFKNKNHMNIHRGRVHKAVFKNYIENPELSAPGQERLLKCDISQKIFENSVMLKLHQKNLQSKNQEQMETFYQCKLCYKSFKLMSSLNKHSLVHDEKEVTDLKCFICEAVFTLPKDVGRHIQRTHFHKERNTRSTKCDICEMTFDSLYKLNRHTRIHTKSLDYSKATEAIKVEKSKSNEIFKCKLCDKSFKTPKGLKMHSTRLHENSIKTIKQETNVFKSTKVNCELCYKTFNTPKGLILHKTRLHSDKITMQEKKVFKSGKNEI